MGEERRKRLQREARMLTLEPGVAQVAGALRKTATATSEGLGSDCYVHAAIAQALLQDLAIPTELRAGHAAWRVGRKEGEVLAHAPEAGEVLPPKGMGFLYHAWLEHDGVIIDLTTYQIRRKARELDRAFGGVTDVQWAPDYLILPRSELRSLEQLGNGSTPGLCYYARHWEIEARLREGFVLDPEDVEIVRFTMRHPQARVYGPSSAQNR
jgi:hypothetical protein